MFIHHTWHPFPINLWNLLLDWWFFALEYEKFIRHEFSLSWLMIFPLLNIKKHFDFFVVTYLLTLLALMFCQVSCISFLIFVLDNRLQSNTHFKCKIWTFLMVNSDFVFLQIHNSWMLIDELQIQIFLHSKHIIEIEVHKKKFSKLINYLFDLSWYICVRSKNLNAISGMAAYNKYFSFLYKWML